MQLRFNEKCDKQGKTHLTHLAALACATPVPVQDCVGLPTPHDSRPSHASQTVVPAAAQTLPGRTLGDRSFGVVYLLRVNVILLNK